MAQRDGRTLALTAMALAPFAAIALGLCLLRNAWLALLLYHLQIVLWLRWVPRGMAALRKGWSASWLAVLAVPCALCAPLLIFVLPHALRADVSLGEWLNEYGLSGTRLVAFACYYGLFHPVLEQLHWGTLRRDPRLRGWAHVAFPAYHVLVLALLLKPGWVAMCFVLLLAASRAWERVQVRLGGLLVPVLSHVIADTAIMGAAYFLATH